MSKEILNEANVTQETENQVDAVLNEVLATPDPPEGYETPTELDPEEALERLENPTDHPDHPDPDTHPDTTNTPTTPTTPTPDKGKETEAEPDTDTDTDPTDAMDPTQFNEREKGLYAAKQKERNRRQQAEQEAAQLKAQVERLNQQLATPPAPAPAPPTRTELTEPVNPLADLLPDDVPTRKQLEEYARYQRDVATYEAGRQQQEQQQVIRDFLGATDLAGQDLYSDYEAVITPQIAAQLRNDPQAMRKILAARTPAGAAKAAYELARATTTPTAPPTRSTQPTVPKPTTTPGRPATGTTPRQTTRQPQPMTDYQVERLAAEIMQMDDPDAINLLLERTRGPAPG